MCSNRIILFVFKINLACSTWISSAFKVFHITLILSVFKINKMHAFESLLSNIRSRKFFIQISLSLRYFIMLTFGFLV